MSALNYKKHKQESNAFPFRKASLNSLRMPVRLSRASYLRESNAGTM